jgi:hypothetical protein
MKNKKNKINEGVKIWVKDVKIWVKDNMIESFGV